jgi:hypothetical protein
MVYNSTLSVSARSTGTNEIHEVSIPNLPLTSNNIISLRYTLVLAQQQDLLAGITLPTTGLPVKYLLIKATNPIDLSIGLATTPTFTGAEALYHLAIYPAAGLLTRHAQIRAGALAADVSVVLAYD